MQRLQPSLTSTKQDLKEESSKQGNYKAISFVFLSNKCKKVMQFPYTNKQKDNTCLLSHSSSKSKQSRERMLTYVIS